jgi:uncharacterized protein
MEPDRRLPPRLRRLPVSDVLDRQVPVAYGFRARLLGLALLDREEAGPGLLIPRCASVHTFGMCFALDIYFLDEEGSTIAVCRAVQPRRIAFVRGAAAVVEIPSASARLSRGASRPLRRCRRGGGELSSQPDE